MRCTGNVEGMNEMCRMGRQNQNIDSINHKSHYGNPTDRHFIFVENYVKWVDIDSSVVFKISTNNPEFDNNSRISTTSSIINLLDMKLF
jgi:hypothetical protein